MSPAKIFKHSLWLRAQIRPEADAATSRRPAIIINQFVSINFHRKSRQGRGRAASGRTRAPADLQIDPIGWHLALGPSAGLQPLCPRRERLLASSRPKQSCSVARFRLRREKDCWPINLIGLTPKRVSVACQIGAEPREALCRRAPFQLDAPRCRPTLYLAEQSDQAVPARARPSNKELVSSRTGESSSRDEAVKSVGRKMQISRT